MKTIKVLYAFLVACLFFLACLFFFSSCRKQSLTPLDDQPINLFYRLTIINLDSTVWKSNVVAVKGSSQILSTPNTGNPANESNGHYDGDGCNENDSKFCSKHPWHKKCQSLPVKLDKFTARTISKGVEVSWLTSYEAYVDRFILERSTDAKEFKPIGSMTPSNFNQEGMLTNYLYIDEIKK